MSAGFLWPTLLLSSLALGAGIMDLATRRIPNWLTFPAMGLGLCWHAWSGGWSALGMGVAGLGMGLLIFLPFFVKGGMGAGDVKLMAAVGAMAGPMPLVVIFIYTGLLGGLAAVLLSASRGMLGITLLNTARLIRHPGAKEFATSSLRLPYGAVIAAGCMLFLWVGPHSL